VVEEEVNELAHEYAAAGKIGEYGVFAETVKQIPPLGSAHAVKEAEHTEPVQNDGFPVASFIADLMPLRQAAVIDAHTPELG
jgi:hypothetical protein